MEVLVAFLTTERDKGTASNKMSTDAGSSVIDRVKMFEARAVVETSTPNRYKPYNRSNIARRYAEAKARASPRASPAMSTASPRQPFARSAPSKWEMRSDTSLERRVSSSEPRDGPAKNPGNKTNNFNPVSPKQMTARGSHFEKVYMSKFQPTHLKKPDAPYWTSPEFRARAVQPTKDQNQQPDPISTSEIHLSSQETASSQDENKAPSATATKDALPPTSPLSQASTAKSSGVPPTSPSRTHRLKAARAKSPIVGRRVINSELRRNLHAAAVTVQEEKASSVGSGSSTRSSLSNAELCSVARRALQLSKINAETRASRIENSPLTQMLMYRRTRKITVEGTPDTAPEKQQAAFNPMDVKSLGTSTITSYEESRASTKEDGDSKASRFSRAERYAAMKRHNQKPRCNEAASEASTASPQPQEAPEHPIFKHTKAPTPLKQIYALPTRDTSTPSPSRQIFTSIPPARSTTPVRSGNATHAPKAQSPAIAARYARAANLVNGKGQVPVTKTRHQPILPGRSFTPDRLVNLGVEYKAANAAQQLSASTDQEDSINEEQEFGDFSKVSMKDFETQRCNGAAHVLESAAWRAANTTTAGHVNQFETATIASDPFSQLTGATNQSRLSRAARARQLKASLDKTKINGPILEENDSSSRSETAPEAVPYHQSPHVSFNRVESSPSPFNDLHNVVASANAQLASVHKNAFNDVPYEEHPTDVSVSEATPSGREQPLTASESRDSWGRSDDDLFHESQSLHTEDKTISPVASDDVLFPPLEDTEIESDIDFGSFPNRAPVERKRVPKQETKFTANFGSVGFSSYSFPSTDDSKAEESKIPATDTKEPVAYKNPIPVPPVVQAEPEPESDIEYSVLAGEDISATETTSRSATSNSIPSGRQPIPPLDSKHAVSSSSARPKTQALEKSSLSVRSGRVIKGGSHDGSRSAASLKSSRLRSSSESSKIGNAHISSSESLSQRVEPIPEDEPLDNSIFTQEETTVTPDGQFLHKERMSTTESSSSDSHVRGDTLRWWQRNYGKKVSGVTNSVVRNAFSRKPKKKRPDRSSPLGPPPPSPIAAVATVPVEDDEDEDIFFGLDDECRPPDKPSDTTTSTNEAERPSASSDESGIPVPGTLLNQNTVVASQTTKRTKKQSKRQKPVIVPPPPPPPEAPKPSSRTPITPQRSGMIVDESAAINPVTSDITSSILAMRKSTKTELNAVQPIAEALSLSEPASPAEEIQGGAGKDDASGVDSVARTLSASPRGEPNPHSIFLNLACGISEQLSDACKMATERSIEVYSSRLHAAEWIEDKQNAANKSCQSTVAICTPKTGCHPTTDEDLFYDEGAHSVASTAVANQSTLQLNADEEKIWNQWDFRDEQSDAGDNASGLVPGDQSVSSKSRRAEHAQRRALAHQRLMEHVEKACVRVSYGQRTGKPPGLMPVNPGEVGNPLLSPTPRSIATEFSFQQLNVLASFSSTLKNKGIEILKANRRNQWQIRFLTVSSDETVTKESNVSAIEQCPKALLWLKTFNARKSNISNSNLRHGGLLFRDVIKVQALQREPPLSPVPKKLKLKFPEFAGVSIEYTLDGGRRTVILCFKNKADAKSFCTAVEVIREVVTRQEELGMSHSDD